MEMSNFDRLLEQYLRGELTGKEKERLEAWLDLKKTRGAEEAILSKQDEERVFQQIMTGIGNLRTLDPVKPKPRIPILWVASIILALLTGVYVAWDAMRESNSPPLSQRVEKMILNDGTLVWLRGESRVAYVERQSDNVRYARLQGEALFEVTKDPARPFVIDCGNITLRVLGTSFTVRSRNDSLQLRVLTGKVSVALAGEQQSIDVLPTQELIYNGSGSLSGPVASQFNIPVISENTEYDMNFRNATLKEVTERISKKFEVSVKVQNPEAERCHLTADFTDRSLESTLLMISEVLDVTYAIEEKSVTITGKGCQAH